MKRSRLHLQSTWSVLSALLAPWIRPDQQRRWAILAGALAVLLLPLTRLLSHADLTAALGGSHTLEASLLPMRTMLGALVVLWSIGLTRDLLEQNQPIWARCVPGHTNALRAAAFLVWASQAIVAGLLAGPLFAQGWRGFWLMAIASAWLVSLLHLSVRWPKWIPAIVATAVAMDMGFRSTHIHVQEITNAQALTLVVLTLAAGGFMSWNIIRPGNAPHRVRQIALRRLAASRGACGVPRSSLGWQDWLLQPYARWLERALASSVPDMERVIIGLGPQAHWITALQDMVWSIVGVPILISMLEWWVRTQGTNSVARPMLLVIVIGGVFTGLCARTLANIASGLSRTRAEQVLLRLAPTVPTGSTLNLRLARRFIVQYGVVTAMMGAALLLWTPCQIGWMPKTQAWLLASAISLLVPGVWLVRDWSHAKASDGAGNSPNLISYAIVWSLAIWIWWLKLPVAPVVTAILLFGAMSAGWRWRQLRH